MLTISGMTITLRVPNGEVVETMSWNTPQTVAEAANSTRRGWAWRCGSKDLAGDYVAVLSYVGMTGLLDADHPLSDHVLTGAEHYRDHYMTTQGPEARTPHPSTVVYYVRDTRSRRVVLARQADGTVLDELDTIRPDLKQSTRDALRAAIAAPVVCGEVSDTETGRTTDN